MGAFASYPIRHGDFAFQPSVNFKHFDTEIRMMLDSKLYDYFVECSMWNAQLLLKYTVYTRRVNPFIVAGPIYSFVQSRSELYGYSYEFYQRIINVSSLKLINRSLGGFVLGSGFTYQIKSGLSGFMDVQYARYYNLSGGNDILKLSDISCSVGLMF